MNLGDSPRSSVDAHRGARMVRHLVPAGEVEERIDEEGAHCGGRFWPRVCFETLHRLLERRFAETVRSANGGRARCDALESTASIGVGIERFDAVHVFEATGSRDSP